MYPEISSNALNNKTILVTGSGDGIGRAVAIQCAEKGATVILLGKTVEKLEKVYDEIVGKGYPEPAIVPMDLQGATDAHYEGLAQTIIDQFGALDGLVLNAGITGKLRPFAQIPTDEWQRVMQVNVTSAYMMVKALIPTLEKASSASVLFVSSGVGRQGRAYWGAYAISKFAVEGMMQTLADEFSSTSIRFNAINPGPTKTELRAKIYPAENTEKLATAEQVGQAFLYFLSDDSRGFNGQSLEAQ